MKRIPWDLLIEVIERFPEGATLEEISLGLSPSVPRRTLQRWLSVLVSEGRLEGSGKTRGRKYKISAPAPRKLLNPTLISIPLSEEAKYIESKVSQPIQNRQPVSYKREFLESYKPNVTYYLPDILRKRLFEMGNTEEGKYPAGTYARQIFHRLLIDLSWNSSRLEGNTYSLLETERLLEKGIVAEGKNFQETQMILNHKAAIEFLISSAEQVGINRYTILNLHTFLSDNLMGDPAASGRLRSIAVGIAKSVYLPSAIPQVIDECFNLIVFKANQIEDPFEQAFFLMVQLPYLQPFDDVNKRTSRLAANIPLIRKNLCPISFIDVPEQAYINGLLGIYELSRIEFMRDVFIWAYERSCALYATTRQSLGQPDLLRMKYRSELQQVVREVVQGSLSKEKAIAVIKKQTIKLIPAEDQSRFIALVERELQSLHEGNIARYGLQIDDYEHWKKSWRF